MNRTLNDIEKDLKFAETELEIAQKTKDTLEEKVNKYRKEYNEYKFNNGLTMPMSELVKYKNNDIQYITLIEKDDNGNLKFVSMSDSLWDCGFRIDTNGHLYTFSRYHNSINFDEQLDKYVYETYYTKRPKDYIGYLDLSIKEK